MMALISRTLQRPPNQGRAYSARQWFQKIQTSLIQEPKPPEAKPMLKRGRPRSFRQGIFDWAEAGVFSLIVVTILFTMVFRVVGVDGRSMMNTLHHGDRLILRCLWYTPQRGDIVVIYRDESQKPLIKRVIGVAGDTIRIDAENNVVYRNGEPLDEPYVEYPFGWGITWSDETMDPDGTVHIPEGMMFVLGDHRDDSADSRINGLERVDRVIGKAVFRIYPLDAWGFIE